MTCRLKKAPVTPNLEFLALRDRASALSIDVVSKAGKHKSLLYVLGRDMGSIFLVITASGTSKTMTLNCIVQKEIHDL